MRIVLSGPKGSGKSTLGRKIADSFGIRFIDTDDVIEAIYLSEKGAGLTCRDIYIAEGADFFRSLEARAVESVSASHWCVISTGGSTFLNPDLKKLFIGDSVIVLLKSSDEFLWGRIKKLGLPPFFQGDNGFELYRERNSRIYEASSHISDIIYEINSENESSAADAISEEIKNSLSLRMNSPSSFGEIIRTSTFGESHGIALGCVMDGIKPGFEISEDDIQRELDRRRPGQSSVTTKRDEKDSVKILSGVFEGKTTGTPICMVVYNQDQDSSKYDNLRNVFRPGHADFTFWKKYGIRDHRGGGRTSGRETIGRVASGALAKKILNQKGIEIFAYSEEIAGISGTEVDLTYIEKNPVRSADRKMAGKMEEAILAAKRSGDSVGGIACLIVKNLPAGIGDPVFFKLDARLGSAIFSIGSVKGVEFGAGFLSARMNGSLNNDQMSDNKFLTNNAGGILGGISNGDEIFARVAVKPTPSISRTQKTVDVAGKSTDIVIEGRHDPCIVPRIIPVIESMAALVILDAMEINNRLNRN